MVFFVLHPDVALSLPCWLSQFDAFNRYNVILYYDGSLVSSNLNSKLFCFHCVRPNVYTRCGHVVRDFESEAKTM